MAEGLTQKRLGSEVLVQSAGLSPAFESAQPEAVAVMQEYFDVDISQHKTRLVFDLFLEEFDWIIALDTYVYDALRARYPDAEDRLVLWDIDDPFGRPAAAYLQSARLIAYCVQKFLLFHEGNGL
jgi:protein-tyrosine-phosphatase